MERALAANHVDGGGAELGIDPHARVRLSRQQQQPPEQLIKPPTATTEHENTLRLEPQRSNKREFQIGRVLLRRMPLGTLDPRQRLRGNRIHITHHQVNPQPQHPRQLGSAVGRDHRRARGKTGYMHGTRATAQHNNRRHRPILADNSPAVLGMSIRPALYRERSSTLDDAHRATPESLWSSAIYSEGMEHLWSPAGATGGQGCRISRGPMLISSFWRS